MANLRDIVRRHVESETREELSDLAPEQQDKVLDMLRRDGDIDRKVDEILNAFLEEVYKPKARKRKWLKGIYSLVNAVLTTFIGIAANVEAWLMLGGFVLVLGIIQVLFIFIDEI